VVSRRTRRGGRTRAGKGATCPRSKPCPAAPIKRATSAGPCTMTQKRGRARVALEKARGRGTLVGHARRRWSAAEHGRRARGLPVRDHAFANAPGRPEGSREHRILAISPDATGATALCCLATRTRRVPSRASPSGPSRRRLRPAPPRRRGPTGRGCAALKEARGRGTLVGREPDASTRDATGATASVASRREPDECRRGLLPAPAGRFVSPCRAVHDDAEARR
jgi:hypothetical protein